MRDSGQEAPAGSLAVDDVTKTQNEAILSYLKEGKSITSMDAFRLFGITRLSGRIYDLRHQGFDIKDIGKKNYAEYVLGGDNEGKASTKTFVQGVGLGCEADGPTKNSTVYAESPSAHCTLERPDSPPIFFKKQGYLNLV